MTAPRVLGRLVLILLAAALALGASSVTGKPITDIRMIEGKWRGQIAFTGGPYQIYYLTINPDATIVAAWGASTGWGKVTLSGGKARFSFPTTSGDLYYYEEKDGRVITMKPDFGGWDVQVRPLK
jgi:uncharacterized protein YndB with AHSA1/START domain